MMIKITSPVVVEWTSIGLAVLEDYAFDDIADALAPVSRVFENFVKLLPLNEPYGIGRALE